MEVKADLFSFRGLVVTALHDIFAVGAIGVVLLGAWIWTGQLPIGALKSESGGISDEMAIESLIRNNPGHDVRLIPQRGTR